MTREEAIECMSERVSIGKTCEQSCMVGFGVNIDILDEAFDMAISALRQQETVTDRHQLNEPLTMDELRKMGGEPVWVVCLEPERYYEPPIGWRIIEKSIVGTFGVWNDSSCLAERDYGETWLAYRQKQEEGNHEM